LNQRELTIEEGRCVALGASEHWRGLLHGEKR
jgi:hypothetical protein